MMLKVTGMSDADEGTATRPAVLARGWSAASEPSQILKDLMSGIAGCDNPSLLAVFVSSHLPADEIVKPLAAAYPNAILVGCTTAGSLAPELYHAEGAVLIAFDSDEFSFETCLLTDLHEFSAVDAREAIENAYLQLLRKSEPEQENFFAMLLLDGLARREEQVAASAYTALEEVPIFGASAGDNLNFDATQIFYRGAVLEGAALVAIGASRRRIEVFKIEHFRPTARRVVVTSADPELRVVQTLDAEPAAEEYARLIGIPVSELTPEVYAGHPLLVRIGGDYHIRAVQKVDAQGALHFYCAIDTGSVLTLAEPEDMRDNLIENMDRLNERLGGLEGVVCFDCILRRLEAERRGIKPDLLDIFDRYGMVGFSTYGEQFQFLHLSQTLTGLAIGRA